MKINFKTNNQDIIDYQLYTASKSERITKKRKASVIRIPISFFFLSILFLLIRDYNFFIGLNIFGVLWYFLYPIILRKYYVKHYTTFVNERMKDDVNYDANIEFTKAFIFIDSKAGETKLNSTELKEVIEISTIIMIILKMGNTVIIPKMKLSNIDEFIPFLKNYSVDLSVPYKTELDWQWK